MHAVQAPDSSHVLSSIQSFAISLPLYYLSRVQLSLPAAINVNHMAISASSGKQPYYPQTLGETEGTKYDQAQY